MVHSYLFVPGNQPEKIKSALKSEAHALIFDLEDAVSETFKQEARNVVAETLTNLTETDKEIYIRINSVQTEHWQEDVELVKKFPVTGIFVPLVEDKTDLAFVHDLHPDIKIVPLIETAKGLMNVKTILANFPQIDRLTFGAIDYCLNLNISFASDHPLLMHAKLELITISRAFNKRSLIDSVYPQFRDQEGLEKEVKAAKDLGLAAKLCIHPAQIETINNVFGFTEEEITWAKKVVATFESATEKGIAAVEVNGEMIDYPMYHRALEILKNLKI